MSYKGNRTLATIFTIVGFQTLRETELFLFCLFSVMYVITIAAHLLIIGLVAIDKHLHNPMYMFLLSGRNRLYHSDCAEDARTRRSPIMLVSFSFIASLHLGATENCLLVVMGYDRYVAICQPLRYTTMMAKGQCLMLSSSNSVLKIPSVDGEKKAFSTCASHLTVVSIFNGTVIFIYLRPTSSTRFTVDKVVSIFYSVVTPLMTPIIYCLRNDDVKKALCKVLQSCGA
ncbi:olfactory receptor 10C1-like [Engystomops pustulosus]|uniref:olfactory receptor 10C1-like n=1 Tax=Engystomops pustulosus TaxID=76066 RepID=UPI003AFA6A8E